MVIREMSKEECHRVLARTRLARLGCASENQPYVVPVYLAYHVQAGGEACLYGYTTPGQKIDWMRANPLVCVEMDEVADYNQWMSVIVTGRFEELAGALGSEDEPPRMPARAADNRQHEDEEREDERIRAYELFKTQAAWWEPCSTAWAVRAHRDPAEPCRDVFYKIWIDQVTGHEATRDAHDAIFSAGPGPAPGRKNWFRGALSRVFGGGSNCVAWIP